MSPLLDTMEYMTLVGKFFSDLSYSLAIQHSAAEFLLSLGRWYTLKCQLLTYAAFIVLCASLPWKSIFRQKSSLIFPLIENWAHCF